MVNDIDDKFLDGGNVIDPRNNKELVGLVEVTIDGQKVKYELVHESTAACTVIDPTAPTEYPTLAAGESWYKGSRSKDIITEINIVNKADSSITNNPDEVWPIAVDSDSDGELDDDIKCYINGTVLTLSGNGAGKIFANPNSDSMFKDFTSLIKINGLNILVLCFIT